MSMTASETKCNSCCHKTVCQYFSPFDNYENCIAFYDKHLFQEGEKMINESRVEIGQIKRELIGQIKCKLHKLKADAEVFMNWEYGCAVSDIEKCLKELEEEDPYESK